MPEHYQRFSQRLGLREVQPALKVDSISKELRNGLWNLLSEFYWSHIRIDHVWSIAYANEELRWLVKTIWADFFKEPLDTMGDWEKNRSRIRKFFFSTSWDEVYDFVDFVVAHASLDFKNVTFIASCNDLLDRESSAYRFVNRRISPIVGKEEIDEIERAATALQIPSASAHICRALELLADRGKPDYLNSVKESISAVEATARSVTGSEKATLGEALSLLEREARTPCRP
jgi:hypothetical protein